MRQLSWTVAYRSGGPYTIEDVDKLGINIKKFYPDINYVVFSDDPKAAEYCDEYFPLIRKWSTTWFSIIECFRYHKAPTLFSGLDTILLRPIDGLIVKVRQMASNEFMMITPFNPNFRARGWMASGIQAWNGDFSFLFKRFDKSPEKLKRAMKMEEEYTTKALKEAKVDILRADHYAKICSYKRHYSGEIGNGKEVKPIEAMDILCFHGLPRPSQITDPFLEGFRT